MKSKKSEVDERFNIDERFSKFPDNGEVKPNEEEEVEDNDEEENSEEKDSDSEEENEDDESDASEEDSDASEEDSDASEEDSDENEEDSDVSEEDSDNEELLEGTKPKPKQKGEKETIPPKNKTKTNKLSSISKHNNTTINTTNNDDISKTDKENNNTDDNNNNNNNNNNSNNNNNNNNTVSNSDNNNTNNNNNNNNNNSNGKKNKKKSKKKRIKELTPEELEKHNQEVAASGVVYIARVPPYMKPSKIRHLLSQHAEIGRIYLKEEDEKRREKRKKAGGNRKRCYVEGWAEFKDKGVARRLAEHLTNQPMGNKKRDRYRDDLWNLKYLPKFKWHHLSEKASYQRAVRDKKLQLAISQTSRENKFYLQNVNKKKMLESMQARQGGKRKSEDEGLSFRQKKILQDEE